MLFDEFSAWALQKGLDMLDDGEEEGADSLLNQDKSASRVASQGVANTRKKIAAIKSRPKGPPPPPKPTGPPKWLELAAQLPVGNDKKATAARIDLFTRFDPNGNGKLSLAEIDKGLLVLFMKCGGDEEVTKSCKPAIFRAYTAAKDVSGSGGANADFVTRGEFRALLTYLQRSFELLALFDEVDTSDDRRVDIGEFTKAVPKLRQWGVEMDDDPAVEFAKIDANGGGHVLFDEFSSWALHKGLDKLEGIPRRLRVSNSPRAKFDVLVEPVAPTPENPILQYKEMMSKYNEAVSASRSASTVASPRSKPPSTFASPRVLS